MNGRAALALFGAWLSICIVIIALNARDHSLFDTDIASILPTEERLQHDNDALRVASALVADRLVLMLTGEVDRPKLASARASLVAALERSGLYEDDRSDSEASGQWLFANREELLCERSAAAFDAEVAKTTYRTALARIYGVGAPVSGDLLHEDPFLLTFRLAECLTSGTNAAGLVTGRLTQPAFRVEVQDRIVAIVNAAEAELANEGIRVLRAGTVFHAAYAASEARREMLFVGGTGLLGIIFLLSVTFRRFSSVLLVTALVGGSLASGLAVSLLVFSEIHVLVLVFATMLIGLAADYAIHALSARADTAWPSREASLALIRSPLRMSMLTTCAGFVSLLLLRTDLFNQLAVFSAAAIATAWFMVSYFLIPLDRPPADRARATARWRTLCRRVDAVTRQQGLFRLLSAGLLAASAVGAAIHTNLDDVRAFQPLSTTLLGEEDAIAEQLSGDGNRAVLISQGSTLEAARLTEEAALAELPDDIDVQMAYTRFDPSLERRSANRAVLESRLFSRYGKELTTRLGLASRSSDGSSGSSGSSGRTDSPDGAISATSSTDEPEAGRPQWLDALHYTSSSGQHYLLAQLSPPPTHLEITTPGADMVDLAATFTRAFKTYRELALWPPLIAVLVACVVVFLRYRQTAAVLIALCPALAMFSGLVLPALAGIPLSFFAYAAALVLFGIGVDYAIFLWNREDSDENWTALSILLGATTSLLSMGLLMLSSTFPIRSFGATVACGVICAFVYAFAFIPNARSPSSAGLRRNLTRPD
ncbi:MAG: hypothetical protein CSB44_01880 [Gammaproteobacteria bacterium]|nr:MAG: hypothetical protein CSB44_01880 [Gammaproteobacteria bacterium]